MQKIASLLLRKNGIPFDKDEFLFQIQSHPSYPSLHSITGVLDHFNIENVAARVPNTQEVLDQLPKSFIAQVNSENGQNLYLFEKKGNSGKLYDEEGKSKPITNEEFLKNFTGIVLAAEKDENSSEKITNKNLLTNIGFVLAAISFLTIFSISTTEISSYAMMIVSLIGVLISISILKQEFGIKNTIGDTFCSSDSEKKDCDAVLTSQGATLFKSYKLSDLSIIYFIGLTTSIFFLSIQGLRLELIYMIGLLSLPITLYSIYYQAVTVKTWCMLCLSIVGVLWVLGAIPFIFQSLSFDFNLQLIEVLNVLIGFLTSFSIWSYLKPKYTEASENKTYKLNYYKFKRKYSLFSTLLTSKQKLDTTIEAKNEIVFGNLNSNLEIIIITNPFCGHCKPVHSVVEDILNQYKDQVKIAIRFNVNLQDPEGDIVKITSNLMHLYTNKGQETCLLAMDEAYNKLDPKDWISKWSQKDLDLDFYLKTLQIQKDWCTQSKINFTPEILINGYSFPKEYERADVLFFIEELSEEYNEESTIEETNKEQVS